MRPRAVVPIMILLAGPALGADAPDPGKETLIDEGVLVVAGRPGFARAEEFSIYRRPDGGYTVLSTIAADDDSYIATATWNYDAEWRALSASGQSEMKGVTRRLEVRRDSAPEGPIVRMTRRVTPKDGPMKLDTFTAPCDRDCLIDLSPGAMPMAVMTRRYDAAKGGAQTFRWVGISLTDDQVLLGGTATIWRHRTLAVDAPVGEVTHWRFREDLPSPNPGETVQMNMHLWTDAALRLRKFGVGRGETPSTIGIRDSDERLSAQMPAD
jgi:hypothetical protein